MAYSGNPSTNTIDAVRLLIGDTGNPPILDDDSYTYFLSLTNQNVQRAAQYSAQAILFQFAQLVDQRVGELEYSGAEAAKNYYNALKMFLSNPAFSVTALSAMPYAGGISNTDRAANDADTDVNKVDVFKAEVTAPTNAADILGISSPFDL